MNFSKDLALVSFKMTDILLRNKCEKTYTTGNFSCVQVVFVLKRDVGYYVFHLFVPSMMCVAASWLSFWIPANQTPARVTLGIATYFTISQQTTSFNQALPKVSYVKSSDIWMVTCKIFVFATIGVYGLAQVSISMLTEIYAQGTKICSDFQLYPVITRKWRKIDCLAEAPDK